MPANETVTELLPNDVLRKKGTEKNSQRETERAKKGKNLVQTRKKLPLTQEMILLCKPRE